MKKYVLEVLEGQSNSAGSKAKGDVSYFLNQDGFQSIAIKIPKNKIKRILFGKLLVFKALKNIKNGIFVFQYPMYSRVFSNYVIDFLRKRKNIKSILVVHDVESLRLNKDEKNAVNKEISFFNKFDKLVSHNRNMTDWLVENGLKIRVENLEIFDYQNPIELSKECFERSLTFAGNLDKSKFLKQIKIQSDIYLMGPVTDREFPENVHYKGVYTPEEVPTQLKKGFGLVWDGNSLANCDGIYGEYMRFNNPHKVSLYLSSGLPVIIWNQSAMADFIIKNKLGLAIDSLNDLDEALEQITKEKYSEFKRNVDQIAIGLRSGKYIKKAVSN